MSSYSFNLTLRGRFLQAFFALLLLVIPTQSFAADGDHNPTFGSGGKISQDTGGQANQLQRLPDGKLIVSGNASLARLNADGSLDTSFGQDGKANTDFLGNYDVATAALLQEDGKLLVAGYTGTESGFVKAALATSRLLDPAAQCTLT